MYVFPCIHEPTFWYTFSAKEDTNIILAPQDCDNTRFYRDVALPPGWTRLTHPEGGCYFKFHHPALVIIPSNPPYFCSDTLPICQDYQGIYTDTEIYDPDLLEEIEAKIDAIDFLRKTIDNFPSSAHIVLNMNGDEPEDTQCYCVNHDDRMIFFLSHFHTEWLQTWGEVKGAYSRRHLRKFFSTSRISLPTHYFLLGHELEAQYW